MNLSRFQTLREEIIPLLIKENKFGRNVKLVNAEINKKYVGEEQYASNVLFVDVFLENDEKKRPLVVKYELAERSLREVMWTEMQFRNEIYAYETVLPFLFETCGRSVDDFFPKFYYGVSNYGYDRPEDDIIIVEDLRPKGFRLAEEKLYLDYGHVAIALKKLAEFHSLSYIAKQEKREEFLEKVKNSKDIYVEGMQKKPEPNVFVEPIKRAFKPVLLKNDEEQNAIIQRFQERLNDTAQLLRDLGTPNDPTAVFCHGDYCRNNVLFKYDRTTNKPIDIRFFDLAMSRYTSPVIDLSFFLFMNTTTEMRQRHWDEFLNIYYGSLRRSLPPHVTAPTFEQLVGEFQERGVYGFMHCSFFVPMTINEDTSVDLKDILQMDAKDISKGLTRYGGERGTQLISEMAQEIIDRRIIK